MESHLYQLVDQFGKDESNQGEFYGIYVQNGYMTQVGLHSYVAEGVRKL